MMAGERIGPDDAQPTPQEAQGQGGLRAPVEGTPTGAVAQPLAPDVDAALVERVQRGDQRAFEMLVVKYQRRIERLIGRMVRDVDLVEDIAQETFIRAYRALHRKQNAATPSSARSSAT